MGPIRRAAGGTRSNDNNATAGIREYSNTMDRAATQAANPLWDAEYARGEAPRRVWDYLHADPQSPLGRNGQDATPFDGRKSTTKTHKYVTGGYFAVASDYHRSIGLNAGHGDFIGDYFQNGQLDAGLLPPAKLGGPGAGKPGCRPCSPMKYGSL